MKQETLRCDYCDNKIEYPDKYYYKVHNADVCKDCINKRKVKIEN